MTIRERIIKLLDVNAPDTGLYKKLVESLELKAPMIDEAFDLWFRGVIQSLFYKVNRHCLVLEGNEIDNYTWIYGLMDGDFYSDTRNCNSIYNSLICNIEFTKNSLVVVEHDNFIILEENAKNLIPPACDKRLASYCSTTQRWIYPTRKSFIVLKVESINFELYNSIPKLQLWQELFNMFK